MGWDALESPSWHVGDHPAIQMLPLEMGGDGMGCLGVSKLACWGSSCNEDAPKVAAPAQCAPSKYM